jgi:hypothetical protein
MLNGGLNRINRLAARLRFAPQEGESCSREGAAGLCSSPCLQGRLGGGVFDLQTKSDPTPTLPCEQGREKARPPPAERRQNGLAGTTSAHLRKPVR